MQIQDYPAELRPFLAGAELYDSSWHSNARTFYVPPDYYLKIDERGELEREAGMTAWFHRQGLSPQVVKFLSRDRDYLLTRRASGETALPFWTIRKSCAGFWPEPCGSSMGFPRRDCPAPPGWSGTWPLRRIGTGDTGTNPFYCRNSPFPPGKRPGTSCRPRNTGLWPIP